MSDRSTSCAQPAETLMENHARRAFSITELLVVIAIIAILAGILFPVFAQAQEQASATGCLSTSRRIGAAVLMYAQDFDEATAPWLTGAECAGQAQRDNLWSDGLQPYFREVSRLPPDGVFECPLSGRAYDLDSGRWLVDPSAASGVDYRYAAGDPITSGDPSGQVPGQQPLQRAQTPQVADCSKPKPQTETGSNAWCGLCIKPACGPGYIIEKCNEGAYDCICCTPQSGRRLPKYTLCKGRGDIRRECPRDKKPVLPPTDQPY